MKKLFHISENEIREYVFAKSLADAERTPVITCHTYKFTEKGEYSFWGEAIDTYKRVDTWQRLTDREAGNKFYKQLLTEGCVKDRPRVHFEW